MSCDRARTVSCSSPATRLADTAAELVADLEPTALADLSIVWGRGNTFDQPPPATCTFAVLDRPGGTVFTERLHVGDPLEVHAAGDIAQGTPIDVAVDGGFEDLAVGPAGNRVATVAPAVATARRRARPRPGPARSVSPRRPAPRTVLRIPPAAFTPGDPTGWDTIPRLGPNEWTWSVAVRPPLNGRTGVIGIGFADPQTVDTDRDRRRRKHTTSGERRRDLDDRHRHRPRDRP